MFRTTNDKAASCLIPVICLATSIAVAEGPVDDIVDTARGLFGVDVDVDNGVRVRAGLIDIRVNSDDRKARRSGQPVWLFRGENLISTPVMDSRHREIGVVDDVVIDLRSGKVRYVAVEYPTLVGRDKLFAVPWDRFQLARRSSGGYYLVMNIDGKRFDQAPGFERTAWPNFADRRWAESVDVYYGVTIRPGDVQTTFGTDPDPVRKVEHLERMSKIGQIAVHDHDSKKAIGSVDDVVIDFATGHARYAILEFPDSIGIADRRFAVPFEKLDFETEDDEPYLELKVDRRQLARAPSFEARSWPNLREPVFAAQVDGFYGVERR